MKKYDKNLEPNPINMKLESKNRTIIVTLTYFAFILGFILGVITLIISFS